MLKTSQNLWLPVFNEEASSWFKFILFNHGFVTSVIETFNERSKCGKLGCLTYAYTALRKWQALIRMIPYAMIFEFLFQVRSVDRFVMLTGQHLAAVRGALLQTFRPIQPYGMYTVHPLNVTRNLWESNLFKRGKSQYMNTYPLECLFKNQTTQVVSFRLIL